MLLYFWQIFLDEFIKTHTNSFQKGTTRMPDRGLISIGSGLLIFKIPGSALVMPQL
jgi:hypothetical protein